MAFLSFWRSAGAYPTFVLFILMLVYLANQMDRYVLSVCSKPMAREIHFGTKVCESSEGQVVAGCSNQTNQESCEAVHLSDNTTCAWMYGGSGFEYQVLAGPVFIVIFTVTGLSLSPLADHPKTNRRLALSIVVFFWSLMNIMASFSKTYWHLVVTRLGLGIFEAICTPFAVSLIHDYFEKSLQGTALGIYNWGIYIGVSLAFALKLLVQSVGWRWTYRVSGLPGVILAPIIFFAVREPVRRASSSPVLKRGLVASNTLSVRQTIRELFQLEIGLVCIASGVRTAAGYVLLYSINQFFSTKDVNVAFYMSWVPLVGGILGATLGGYVSDRLTKKYGLQGRIALLVASQLLAAPFAFGLVLFSNPTLAFFSFLLSLTLGEAFLGVSLAVVTSLVSMRVRTIVVALFMFITSNMGGNATLLVPILNSHFPHKLEDTLLLLFSSSYLIAAVIFGLVLGLMRRRGIGYVAPGQVVNVNSPVDEESEDDCQPLLSDSPMRSGNDSIDSELISSIP